MTSGETVRPTFHVLEKLGLELPNLGVSLAHLEHPLVIKAQELPRRSESDPPELIRAVQDIHWYKVKAAHYRGGATKLATLPEAHTNRWWLGLAGIRQADSPQHNFYDNLPADSTKLLPTSRDWDRAKAEAVVALHSAFGRIVRRAAYVSLTEGIISEIRLGEDIAIRARILVEHDGSTYLTLGGMGIHHQGHYILILSAFRGIDADDWMIEPAGALHLQPEPGEMLFSTLLPDELREWLIQEFSGDES